DIASNLALLLDEQALHLVEVGLDRCARASRALDRLDPEGGARQEPDCTVVDVPRQRQSCTHPGADLDRIEQSIAAEQWSDRAGELAPEIQEGGRQAAHG